MKLKHLLFLQVLFFSFQMNGQQADTLKNYNLNDVTVKGALILEPESFVKIPPEKIAKADPVSVFDLGRKLPSVKVQTNSRGESLFFFRGAGERQLTLFFDGISINIPWDNRIDLSLIPAEAIGEINILKGVPPAIFGANAISGVINISTKDFFKSGQELKLSGLLGQINYKKLSGLWVSGKEDLSYLISASYRKSDGYNLPEDFESPANPSKERINSGVESKNFLGKIDYRLNDYYSGGFSISYFDSKKNVPPEIGVSNPRYWRYPEWKNLTLSTDGNLKLDSHRSALYYSFAFTSFKMEIDQFKDATFTKIDEIEKNDDSVLRGRLIYTNIISNESLLKIALNGHLFNHKESFLSSNFANQKYSENILSAGAEYEYVKKKFVVSVGASYDFISTPQTGDKPAKESVSDFALNGAVVYSISSSSSIRFNAGRKTRFPSLRETFSGALGRFVPNPGLKAESAMSAELSYSYHNAGFSIDASAFLTYLKDGIVRISLPKKQFMRVNKDQIRTYGLEIVTGLQVWKDLSAAVNFTYLKARGKNSGEFKDTLEYKPEISLSSSLDYSVTKEIGLTLEVDYVGNQFGLKEGTTGFQKLPDYLLLNTRLGYNFEIGVNRLEVFVRINNIFDRLYYTQFGLPEAGRQFLFGVNFKI